MIPPSYLYVEASDRARAKAGRQAEWLGDPVRWPTVSCRRILGIDRSLVAMAGAVIGLIGYGGLMELIL